MPTLVDRFNINGEDFFIETVLDDAPTEDSQHGITSDGVYRTLMDFFGTSDSEKWKSALLGSAYGYSWNDPELLPFTTSPYVLEWNGELYAATLTTLTDTYESTLYKYVDGSFVVVEEFTSTKDTWMQPLFHLGDKVYILDKCSSDMEHWTSIVFDTPSTLSRNLLFNGVYADGVYLVDCKEKLNIMRSTDGIVFSPVHAAGTSTGATENYSYTRLSYIKGRFFWCTGGITSEVIQYSTDGSSWTIATHDVVLSQGFRSETTAVQFSKGKYLVGFITESSSDNAKYYVLSSSDGVTFTSEVIATGSGGSTLGSPYLVTTTDAAVAAITDTSSGVQTFKAFNGSSWAATSAPSGYSLYIVMTAPYNDTYIRSANLSQANPIHLLTCDGFNWMPCPYPRNMTTPRAAGSKSNLCYFATASHTSSGADLIFSLDGYIWRKSGYTYADGLNSINVRNAVLVNGVPTLVLAASVIIEGVSAIRYYIQTAKL